MACSNCDDLREEVYLLKKDLSYLLNNSSSQWSEKQIAQAKERMQRKTDGVIAVP